MFARHHVAVRVGHADPRVTLGIYSHIIGESQRNAVEKIALILDLSRKLTVSGFNRPVRVSDGI